MMKRSMGYLETLCYCLAVDKAHLAFYRLKYTFTFALILTKVVFFITEIFDSNNHDIIFNEIIIVSFKLS